MIVGAIILLVLGAGSLTLFLIRKLKGYSVEGTIIKAFTSLLFISLAVYSAFNSGHHILSLFAIIALAFGLTGDIWLELKYVFREHDKILTYAGFASFLIGHVLYICGFYLEFFSDRNPLYVILPLVVGALMGGVVLLMEKPLKLNYGNMKAIVGIYGSLLFMMAFSAISLTIMTRFQNVSLVMIAVGGILFAVSDLILCGTYFGEGKDKPFDLISNAVTYYGAQFIIAFALFFL